ncbi:GntR family transcriptional regulator [Methylovirgula sp. HY1]|uniref:GntR family transcriptional regulator n=1 Tax=Methylovirgula sp. HY1 TaxID=2822761 RepID=UPI001C5B88DF|nr:GntR family transcriptional regulator [Methylovirgula sp. HY1]QXX74803.1 HTH-type transcriptional repressor RspR [Methylovirgula sp. HY1]
MTNLPHSRTASSSKRSLNAANDELFPRIRTEESFKSKVYTALKDAIIKMDVYSQPAPVMLDERELSDRLGVSRTPIREAVAMLEQDGFLRTVPRRGILVVRKTKREIIEMVQAWAALESMAVRLITLDPNADVASLRQIFKDFSDAHKPTEHLNEYSSANIAFHQAIIRMSGSQVLCDITDNLLLHVRGIRQLTIGKLDRAQRSIEDHLAIITAIENRETETAEKLSREHTLGLAAFIEEHGNELFE